MKKLIIAVLAAMVFAGTAFAAGIGVEIQGGVNLADGSTTKVGNATTANTQDVAAVKARGWFIRNRITASGEYGKFGAWFRYDANSYWGGQSGTGNVWWKPVDQFRLLIGGNPDGLF
ncbi:MAG: hypothetical protein FWF29_07745, partial [Treponema sp.]|nr:hypothetical protein [Treponema sp.]